MLSHEAKLIPINSVKPFKGNARVGNLEVIRESLRRNGQYRPIVIRTKTKEVLAGNHTWLSAKMEGWTEIWATFVDCDTQTAKRINLVDNRAPELGGYDEEALIALLGSTSDLMGTGWTDTDVQRLTSDLVMGVGGDTDPSKLPQKPKTRRGDVYVMGEHRLMCGDSTNARDVERLIADAQPVCMWTDPPYLGPDDNSSQGGKAKPLISSHSVDSLKQLLLGAFHQADQHLARGAAIYVMHPGGANSVLFGNCFVEQGWRVHQTIVWLKESIALGYRDYRSQHELMYEGDKYDGEFIAFGFAKQPGTWYGNRKQSNVFEFPRPAGKLMALHPTIKPVAMIERCLLNSTKKSGLVYDPFCGSGTTLIAAANLNRRAVVMEIDPGYCDVIVDRWERHTGGTAEVEHA